MRIALDLKENCQTDIFKELEERGFDVTNNSSFGTIWVYGLSHIDYSKGSIELNQAGSMKFYTVYLEDLEYFEIHN